MMPNSYQFKFELRHLRSFMAIAEELSFRKAAAKLHVAQPALSRQMAQLEESIGYPLFDRRKRRIKLTAAGEFFYAKLPKLFNELAETIQQIQQIASGQSVTLKVGYSSAAMSCFVPSVIQEIQNNIEDCEFKFVEETSDELIDGVISERLDAAFILCRPNNTLLRTIPIKADQTGVILPDTHPLAKKKCIALGELKQETLILFPRVTNPIMYDEIIACCYQAGFSPQAIIETAPRSTAIGLVAAGQGVATIAASLQHTCVKGTTFRPLVQPAPMINYSCITRADRAGKWLDVLISFIQRELS